MICADFYSGGSPQPPMGDIKNLFPQWSPHLYVLPFYPLLLEFWKNIKKWLIKTFWRERFWRKLWFSVNAPKRPPPKHENKPPNHPGWPRKKFKHTRVTHFFMLNPMIATILLYLLKQRSNRRFSIIPVVVISRAQHHPVMKIKIFFHKIMRTFILV